MDQASGGATDLLRWGNGVFELVLDLGPGRPARLHGLRGRGTAPVDGCPGGRPDGSPDGPSGAGPTLVEVLTPARGRDVSSLRAGGGTRTGGALRPGGTWTGEVPRGTAVLRVRQRDAATGLVVTSVFQAWPGVSGYRTWTELEATGDAVTVEAVTSFRVPGTGPRGDLAAGDLDLLWARSGWVSEGRWRRQALRDVLPDVGAERSRNRFALTSLGSWSTGEFLPTGVLAARDGSAALGWQVEHCGGWSWEVIEDGEGVEDGGHGAQGRPGVLVAGCGPAQDAHQWSVTLAPGERFASVPASVVVTAGGYQDAVAELTLQRRALLAAGRPDRSAGHRFPVVYNDYMNTLGGDPTSEREVPLIDAAADVGADVFCIDAGWYDDSGSWYDAVGEWRPSVTRFPDGGLAALTERIRTRGMVPGLWLEPEVVGVRSPLAGRLPDDAFFARRGERVCETGRYHLDLRSDVARHHLDATVDRLVADLGVGFLKLDHNSLPGPGTDVRDPSPGAGLLGHGRAYLDWLDGLVDRHPGLLLENCASGAMRADYAVLSRADLQSTSDQTDPLRYAFVAAAAPLAVLPEQAGNWAYPQPGMTAEEAAFTLANGVLGRLYLSGFLDRADARLRDLVREAVAVHREVLAVLPRSVPCWPLGLPGWTDGWLALGLRPSPGEPGDPGGPGREVWVTAWHRHGDGVADLDLGWLAGRDVQVTQRFPAGGEPWTAEWTPAGGRLRLRTGVAGPSARVLRLDVGD